MPLLDLSLVTKSLITLIREHVTNSPAWPDAALTVSSDPPDKIPDPDHTDHILVFYLYHITEDAHWKNLPAVSGRHSTPVRHTPMALNLYYILTAYSEASDSALDEQRMMGCAIKALHDFPVITEATEIGGKGVLDSGITDSDTHLRIALQPIQPETAVSYWTAGSKPLRLSAYYQVSVVLLEAEEPGLRAGRVLKYGVDVFPGLGPRLVSNENSYTITLPGESEPRTIEVRPAQVPIGGQVTFIGSGLSGDQTTLLLSHTLWDQPAEVGADWGIAATNNRLLAVVQSTAEGRDVKPGVYTAQARVTRLREIAGGGTREMTQTSNAMPFMIVPHIDAVYVSKDTDTSIITGPDLASPDPKTGGVQVFLAETRLDPGTVGSLNVDEFAVLSADQVNDDGFRTKYGLAEDQINPDVVDVIEIRLPTKMEPGALPVRVFFNGAESPPKWVEVSA